MPPPNQLTLVMQRTSCHTSSCTVALGSNLRAETLSRTMQRKVRSLAEAKHLSSRRRRRRRRRRRVIGWGRDEGCPRVGQDDATNDRAPRDGCGGGVDGPREGCCLGRCRWRADHIITIKGDCYFPPFSIAPPAARHSWL